MAGKKDSHTSSVTPPNKMPVFLAAHRVIVLNSWLLIGVHSTGFLLTNPNGVQERTRLRVVFGVPT